MVDPKLLNYVREQTAAGFSQADVVAAALGAGWGEADVSAALSALNSAAPWATAQNPEPAVALPQQSASGRPAATWRAPAALNKDEAAGLVGLVIKWGLAHNRQQAQIVLVGIMLIALGVFGYNMWSYLF